MYEELLDLYDNYVSNHKYADNIFVNQVFIIVNRYHPIGKYLKEVYVTNKDNEYKCIDKIININLQQIYKAVSKLSDVLEDDFVYLYNLVVLETIFHELEHVYQEEVKDKGENNLETFLLVLSDSLVVFPLDIDYRNLVNRIKLKLKSRRINKYYHKNHDMAPYERMAEIRAYGNTINLIGEYSTYNLGIVAYCELVNHMLGATFKNGYKIIGDKTNSPSLDYIRGMKGSNNKEFVDFHVFHDMNICLQDRLLYGLELTKDEYHDLLRIEEEQKANSTKIKIR